MSATIEYAHYFAAGSDKPILVCTPDSQEYERGKAAVYDPEGAHAGGSLVCPCTHCKAELHFSSGAKRVLGDNRLSRVSHFRRAPDAEHNRAGGCEYPNRGDLEPSKKISEQNKLIKFIETHGTPYIYLGAGFASNDFVLGSSLAVQYRRVNGHMTVKKNEYDATINVKSAADFHRLRQLKQFDDPFYDRVQVVSDGYQIPFRTFLQRRYKRLFNTAYFNAQQSQTHGVLTEIVPLTHKTHFDAASMKGRYSMECMTQPVAGPKSGFVYNVRPILTTNNPAIFEAMKEGRYLVWANEAIVDPDLAIAQTHAILDGRAGNNMPIRISIKTHDQLCYLGGEQAVAIETYDQPELLSHNVLDAM